MTERGYLEPFELLLSTSSIFKERLSSVVDNLTVLLLKSSCRGNNVADSRFASDGRASDCQNYSMDSCGMCRHRRWRRRSLVQGHFNYGNRYIYFGRTGLTDLSGIDCQNIWIVTCIRILPPPNAQLSMNDRLVGVGAER
jgi:hypothetical protein